MNSRLKTTHDQSRHAVVLLEAYRRIRSATEALCTGLSAEDCAIQSMPDASPVKWHLAHTSWYFETFVLTPELSGYQPFQQQFKMLFNSYYVGVGDRHPRSERGLLSRPSLEEVFAYRQHVDRNIERWIETRLSSAPMEVFELGLNHEQQHQELILTDLKHLFSRSPLKPSYRKTSANSPAATREMRWLTYPPGLSHIGWDGDGFAFDNELPRHQQYVEGFQLAARPVTCREYLAFIDDGGYERAELWLSDGWEMRSLHRWTAPLYWEKKDENWYEFTLMGLRALDLDSPVCHVSFYEAEAYARWANARLPTEAEWESVAVEMPTKGHFAESGILHPIAATDEGDGPHQMFGDVWEWTGSAYLGYPGYRPVAGAVGEYNGKFMVNQFVLRGGSCATPWSHIRPTYRNFFPPHARWQFSGIRLARPSESR